MTKFGFGRALEHLEAGRRVAREGWNGKGMFAYLVPAASYPVQTGAAKAHFGEGSMVPYRAYFALKTAQDDVATWSPSVGDALAKDWFVLDAVDEDGDIVARGAMRVTITVDGEHTSLHILTGTPPSQAEELFERAIKALIAERDEMGKCPVHAKPELDALAEKAAPGFHRYRSHKIVEAVEIVAWGYDDVGNWVAGADGKKERLQPDIFARYKPEPGDFLVRYANGYLSISPRQTFLDGYTRISED